MFFTATEEPLKLLGDNLIVSDSQDFKFNLLSGKIFYCNFNFKIIASKKNSEH